MNATTSRRLRRTRGRAARVLAGTLALGALLAGCGGRPPAAAGAGHPSARPSATPWDGTVHVIGDGSTSYTGPQPKQPAVQRLKPGRKPPQFVVFSFDGGLEDDSHMFSHFRELGERHHAQMTFFLSGIYLLPKAKRDLYHPPQNPVGSAAIDFPTNAHIRATLKQLAGAWADGDEIGTHFNGHFCDDTPHGGDKWTTKDWKSEIDQAYWFVEHWKTTTGFTDLPPLPFDYRKELVGGRAPCLEGQKALLPDAKALGWRYDASSAGEFQAWPHRIDGLWDFPLQLIPYPGTDTQLLSMDFNFLYNQTGGEDRSADASPAQEAAWEKQAEAGYLAGFNRAYHGSRAPFLIGNHFESWNGGIYMKAVGDAMEQICGKPGVRCVSFKELADWMDAQDPKVLAKLRQLDPGESPDWSTFLK